MGKFSKYDFHIFMLHLW